MKPFEQQLIVRLEDYALAVINLYAALPQYPVTGHQVAQTLGKQLLRSGTSVGANFAEATRAHSLADKVARQQICLKEPEETAYWLRLTKRVGLTATPQLDALLGETSELTAILVTSVRKLRDKA